MIMSVCCFVQLPAYSEAQWLFDYVGKSKTGPGLSQRPRSGPGEPRAPGPGLLRQELQWRWLFQGPTPRAAAISHVTPFYPRPKISMFDLSRVLGRGAPGALSMAPKSGDAGCYGCDCSGPSSTARVRARDRAQGAAERVLPYRTVSP